jgi:exodeoxyribonuclease VII small subunit
MTAMPPSPADRPADGPAPSSQSAGSPQIASFEDGLATLSDLVVRLESGSLGLSESIDAYERGVAILRLLHEELSQAEERVSVLVRIDEEGRPILAPHEAGSAAASEPAPVRRPGRRQAPAGRSLPGMDDLSAEA